MIFGIGLQYILGQKNKWPQIRRSLVTATSYEAMQDHKRLSKHRVIAEALNGDGHFTIILTKAMRACGAVEV